MGKQQMPDAAAALKGRDKALEITGKHFVNGVSIKAPFPAGIEQAYFGLGCFWGAERRFWQQRGVYATAVGYAGGYTPNPTYEEVCSGDTGHAEVVLVAFDPSVISYDDLLRVFWEVHDPTQGMRQGNDLGTQYRSVIFTTSDQQLERAKATFAAFQKGLKEAGKGAITTEIAPAPVFYYGEEYHQQYLAKNPAGYCGLAGTGVCLMPE